MPAGDTHLGVVSLADAATLTGKGLCTQGRNPLGGSTEETGGWVETIPPSVLVFPPWRKADTAPQRVLKGILGVYKICTVFFRQFFSLRTFSCDLKNKTASGIEGSSCLDICVPPEALGKGRFMESRPQRVRTMITTIFIKLTKDEKRPCPRHV